MTLDPVERLNLAFAAGTAAISVVLVSPAFAASVALGAVLETANFRALRRAAAAFLGLVPGSGLWIGGFGLRFLLLGVGVGVALWAGAHPAGLILGLSLIMPAVVIAAWRNRPPVVECPPGPPPDDESWDAWNPWLARERAEEEDEA